MNNYTERLNLTFDPFEPAAASKEFFAGGNRQQLLDQLIEHSLYSQSIMAVTGCLGCGKTTLANTFCQSFGEEAVCVLVPATLFMNKSQFLEKLGEQIPVHLNDEETESALVSIQGFATQLDLEAKSLMIVIDDAHELSSDVLDLVTSLAANATSGIHVLMFGETQLLSMLQTAMPAEMGQSLLEFEIAELGGEDTVEYVKFKLAEAGFAGELPVSGSELGNIHNSANGIPGTINALVSNALDNASESIPAAENLPAFVSKGNYYWAIAASLVVLLVTAFVVMEPDPRIEQQQSIATNEIPIDVPVGSQQVSAPSEAEPAADSQQPSVVEEPPFTESEAQQVALSLPTEVAETTADAALAMLENENIVETENTETELEAIEIAEVESAEISISEYERSLLQFPGSSYTVQIMGSHSEINVQRFIEEELVSTQRGYFETRFQDKPWFVVLLGQYEDRSDASKAIEELPASLRSLQPWIRSIADIQSDIRELNSIN